jgi:hypothetical protein
MDFKTRDNAGNPNWYTVECRFRLMDCELQRKSTCWNLETSKSIDFGIDFIKINLTVNSVSGSGLGVVNLSRKPAYDCPVTTRTSPKYFSPGVFYELKRIWANATISFGKWVWDWYELGIFFIQYVINTDVLSYRVLVYIFDCNSKQYFTNLCDKSNKKKSTKCKPHLLYKKLNLSLSRVGIRIQQIFC